jgi:hypothetical protein
MTIKAFQPNALTANGAFEIYLAWSERTLTVGASHTALEVMLAAGLPIDPDARLGHAACARRPTSKATSSTRTAA